MFRILVLVSVIAAVACSIFPPRESKIVGGTTASASSYHVAIKLQKNHDLICGAVIINRRYVLTAAHCVFSLTAADIYINFGSVEHCSTCGRKLNIDEIILHEYYSPDNNMNDVALLKAASYIELDGNIQAAKIPKTVTPPYCWSTGKFSGWGITSVPSHVPSATLKEVQMVVQTKYFCQQRLGISGDRTFCAKATNSGPCSGDDGGPLVNNDNEVVGISSWRISCAKDEPEAFTNVGYYALWIYSRAIII